MYVQHTNGKWYGPSGHITGQIEGIRFVIQWSESDDLTIKVKMCRSLSGALKRVKKLRKIYGFKIESNGQLGTGVFFERFESCVIYKIKDLMIKDRVDCVIVSDYIMNNNPEI